MKGKVRKRHHCIDTKKRMELEGGNGGEGGRQWVGRGREGKSQREGGDSGGEGGRERFLFGFTTGM